MRQATELVLRVLLHDPTRPLYNRQIANSVDLDAGTTHGILGRLVDAGHAESQLEEAGHVRGRPRRFYRLTPPGRRWAAAMVEGLSTIAPKPDGVSDTSPRADVLHVPEVAAILGVGHQTLWLYLRESVAPGKYATRPFPAEDGRDRAGRFWQQARASEIRTWQGALRSEK